MSTPLHAPLFGGKTYSASRDQSRLTSQLAKVFELMKDGKFRTIPQIVREIGWQGSEAGVSARLRDLRKPHFGHTVNRRYLGEGLYEYQLVIR